MGYNTQENLWKDTNKLIISEKKISVIFIKILFIY